MTDRPVPNKAAVLSRASAVVRDLAWDASTEFQNLEIVLADLKVRDQETFVDQMRRQLERLKNAATVTKAVKFSVISMVEQAQEIKDGS